MPLKHTTSQSGWSFFGRNCEFIGIDSNYIAQVSYREIFLLVEHGFSAEYLESIPLARRRYFFNLLIERHKAESERISGKKDASTPLPNFSKDKIKNGQKGSF